MTSLRLQKAFAAVLVLTTPQLFPTSCMGCSNPPPGVSRMIRGVDITELDLLPLFTFGSSNDGFKNPVVNFTCHEGKTWRSPRGGDFQLPDQVWHMNSLPGGWLQADTRVYKTHKDVRNTMSWNVGGGLSLLKFSFSASTSYKKMQQTITNTSNVFTDTGAFDSATQVDFIPSWRLQLDAYAKDFVDTMLPPAYDSDPATYIRFIKEFGTHYFDSANFGGYIRVVNEVSQNYFSSTTEKNVTVQAKASFFKIIEASGGSVSTSTKVDERFTESSTTTTRYYGGYTNLLTESGIQQWQPTVYSDPWLFSGKLKPISDLISDSTKKASMVKAITQYVLKSYLEEQEGLLASIRTSSRRSGGTTGTSGLKSRVEALKQKDVLEESEVLELAQDVEAELEPRTYLCSTSRSCNIRNSTPTRTSGTRTSITRTSNTRTSGTRTSSTRTSGRRTSATRTLARN